MTSWIPFIQQFRFLGSVIEDVRETLKEKRKDIVSTGPTHSYYQVTAPPLAGGNAIYHILRVDVEYI